MPYDRGRFGAFLSSVAHDAHPPTPPPPPPPSPPPPPPRRAAAGGGGGEQSASMRSGRQARPRILAGKNWPLAFWVLQECVAAIRPEPARRRCRAAHAFGPENRPRPALRPFFRRGATCARNARGFWMGGRGERSRRPGRQKNRDSEAWAPRSAALRTASIVLKGVEHAVQGRRGGVGSGATARGRSHVGLPCLLEDRLKACQHRHRKP